ncbi:hypothetical protein [Streptomyces sp. NPDC049915]|uniref:hypothetical protein n=1 Tax=Streptomyces sp. NPDC049915 TaxID=3155510 RepID=UPI0034172F30
MTTTDREKAQGAERDQSEHRERGHDAVASVAQRAVLAQVDTRPGMAELVWWPVLDDRFAALG